MSENSSNELSKSAVQFNGRVEAVSPTGITDREYIVIDGKTVTTSGEQPGSWGTVSGNRQIGSEAEVFALQTDANSYTLHGNTEYYVRIKP